MLECFGPKLSETKLSEIQRKALLKLQPFQNKILCTMGVTGLRVAGGVVKKNAKKAAGGISGESFVATLG